VISTAGYGPVLIIACMALVTLLARFGGVFIMGLIPLNRRMEGFINGMAGSVLIAVLVPIALQADAGGRLALLATGALMLWLKQPMPAIALGIAVAALYRAL
tara:strand:+ start:3795 stop:4100 length:306 start_codon:yes stop_codon:yes gene_type:complete